MSGERQAAASLSALDTVVDLRCIRVPVRNARLPGLYPLRCTRSHGGTRQVRVQWAAAGARQPPLLRRPARGTHADVAHLRDACSAVVENLFRVSGASATITRRPLRLIARNCRAGSLHAGHN
ncbi:hypothetical protein [Streptomyces sp. NPDC057287]|uniref:hypothetical protein n=1 Tax=Streptomyces sp. NPDC057287 TaxID=3346086 RepID=UPI00363010FF